MSACIEWPNARNDRGYGTRYTKDRGKVYVHRWVWEQFNGPIPEGMEVMHSCDNPPCFLLEHLSLGTRLDNARDMAQKGRSGRGNRPRRDVCRNGGHPIMERNGHRWCPTCRKAHRR
jgi:hypothetical protein